MIKYRKRISEILDPTHSEDKVSKLFNFSIMGFIFLNVMAVIFETMPSYGENYAPYFVWLELISVTVFTIEYSLRVWSSVEKHEFQKPSGRLSFALTPMAFLDLLAILPFYLPILLPYDLRFLRVLRLIRIFSVLKLAKYSKSVGLLLRVLKNKKAELIVTVFVAIVLLVLTSGIIFFIENGAQPEVFSSIPAAMWWTIGATTRLGIGPINPITELGMLFGAIVALLGLGVFALPAGILASGLIEEIESIKTKKACPSCGFTERRRKKR